MKHYFQKLKSPTLIGIAIILLILLGTPIALGEMGNSYDLSWSVIGGGGDTSSGGTYELADTVSQPVAGGESTGGSYELYSGYWAGASPEPVDDTLLAIYVLAFDNRATSPSNLTPHYPKTREGIINATIGAEDKTAVVLVDLHDEGDTHILVVQDGEVTPIVGLPDANGELSTDDLHEYDVTDEQMLGNFLTWARETYPTSKTTFTYSGHGTALAPDTDLDALFQTRRSGAIPLPIQVDLDPDTTDHHPELALISPYDLAQALDIATNGGQDKLDVLDIYHCFSASIEEFYEVADYAETIVGSPNYAFFEPSMLGQALSNLQTSMSAQEMATSMVNSYHTALPTTEHPHILVAVESSQIPPIKDAMDQLSYYLMQEMNSDLSGTKAKISNAYQESGKYDSTFCEPQDWKLEHPDALSDLADFAYQLEEQFGSTSPVGIPAGTVNLLVDNALITRQTQDGIPWFGTHNWDFTNHSGISLYTDFEGMTFPNDDNYLYLSWQGAFYNTDSMGGQNLHPYSFVRGGMDDITWEDVFNKFWEGVDVETALCHLPTFPPIPRPGEVAAIKIHSPLTGTVSVGSPVLPSVEMSTQEDTLSLQVKFEMTQSNKLVYSDTVGVGNLVAGTHTLVKASKFFTPTATGAFTLTAMVDADDRIEESNENNNTASLNDTVWPAPTSPRPIINVELTDNQQWNDTTVVSLNISQSVNTQSAAVKRVIVQAYQYSPGINPNTQVATQVGPDLKFNDLSLPLTDFVVQLPSGIQPGLVELHIWGQSIGGLSAQPIIVRFNHIPASTCIDEGSQHYYLFNANSGDPLTFNLNAQSGDPNLFLWMPHNYGRPTWQKTDSGNDSLDESAPTSGEYLLSVYAEGESEACYTLSNGTRQNVSGGRQVKTTITNNLDPHIPDTRPIFIDPIPEAPDVEPLAVQLEGPSATASTDDILITWSTLFEVDNLGFNLYRSSEANQVGEKINDTMIPSQTPGGGAGAFYEWQDEAVESGETYYYWLEDVDLDGIRTMHGPVSATVGIPSTVTLTTFAISPLPDVLWLALILFGLTMLLMVWRMRWER